MPYKLSFSEKAIKEWKKLDSSVKKDLQKKISHRINNPCISSSKLSGFNDLYKIKFRSFRLVYKVINKELVVLIITIGKRNSGEVYKNLHNK